MGDVFEDYGELEAAARRLADAVDAWDADLSRYCDGPQRDEVREAVVAVRARLDQ